MPLTLGLSVTALLGAFGAGGGPAARQPHRPGSPPKRPRPRRRPGAGRRRAWRRRRRLAADRAGLSGRRPRAPPAVKAHQGAGDRRQAAKPTPREDARRPRDLKVADRPDRARRPRSSGWSTSSGTRPAAGRSRSTPSCVRRSGCTSRSWARTATSTSATSATTAGLRPAGRGQGYDDPGGENVARGQRDAADVMTSWMNSEGHRANILNCSFKAIGVGAVKGVDGTIVWGQISDVPDKPATKRDK